MNESPHPYSIDVQPVWVTLRTMTKTTALLRNAAFSVSATSLLAACSPTVRLEAPREPITINLNVKIDQEVRVKLDKEVEDLITDNPDLF